jgi:hypothetical protein
MPTGNQNKRADSLETKSEPVFPSEAVHAGRIRFSSGMCFSC